MGKKKTTEQFKKEVFDLVGDDYEVLGEYVNNHTYIPMRHNVCGHEYPVRPSKFIIGRRCPKCFGTCKKTTEQFKLEVFKLVGHEYEVMDEYIDNKTNITMRHNVCGYEYPVKPNKFLIGRRCPKCYRKHQKTTEQFKQELFNRSGDEYEVLGEYINYDTGIRVRHKECGHEWEPTPHSLLSKKSFCPNCTKNIRKDTKSFKQEVFELVGDEYEVLGEYVNNKTKIEVMHRPCGRKYSIEPNNFLRGNGRCLCVSQRKRRGTETFKQEIMELVGDEYEVLSEFVYSDDYVVMRHNKLGCGYVWNVTPSNFIHSKTRCPKCAKRIKRDTESFKQEVFELVGDEYEVLSEYITANDDITIEHKKCGHIWTTTPSRFTNNKSRCPICFGTPQKTTEQFKKEVYDLVGNEYTVLGEYETAHKDITMIHNKCGYKWEITPNQFINKGSRCPQCNESKGEEAVRRYLESINQSYEIQHIFTDLRTAKTGAPKFDFYLKEMNAIIEFDGIQHFRPVERFNGKKGFQSTHRCDLIKTAYCEKKNILLLRIRFDQMKSIPEMINDLLENPDFYLKQHNTYLNNEEYYFHSEEPLDDVLRKPIRMKAPSQI